MADVYRKTKTTTTTTTTTTQKQQQNNNSNILGNFKLLSYNTEHLKKNDVYPTHTNRMIYISKLSPFETKEVIFLSIVISLFVNVFPAFYSLSSRPLRGLSVSLNGNLSDRSPLCLYFSKLTLILRQTIATYIWRKTGQVSIAEINIVLASE